MKILVMSDSHGAARTLRAVLEKHRDADLVIHLGDGEREMAAILRFWRSCTTSRATATAVP